MTQRARRWFDEVVTYASETRSPAQFVRVMRARLALSKVGGVVCPEPMTTTTGIKSLGGEVVLRSHTSDISVLNELIVSDGYEAAARLLPRPATIVDLGANTGLAARWFLSRWPGVVLVAVEPEPGNVAVLRRNLAGFPATVLPVAAGGSERSALLSTSNGEFAFTIVGAGGPDAIEVPVVTMATVLEPIDGARIDLLKVDIEGAERELFADCSGWIDRVDAMVVECHGGYSGDDLIADCSRGGADFTVVDRDTKPGWGFEVVTAVRAQA